MKKRQKIPIQRRLIGFLLFVSLIPLAAMGCYGIIVINRNIKASAKYRMDTVLTMHTMKVRDCINRAQDELITISNFTELNDLFINDKVNKKALDDALSRAKTKLAIYLGRQDPTQMTKFSRISFIGSDGKELYKIVYSQANKWQESDSLKDYLHNDAFAFVKQSDPLLHWNIQGHLPVFISTTIDDTLYHKKKRTLIEQLFKSEIIPPGIEFLIPFYSKEKQFRGLILALLENTYICESLMVHEGIETVKPIPLEFYLVNQRGDILLYQATRKKTSPISTKRKTNIRFLFPEEVIEPLLSPVTNVSLIQQKKNILKRIFDWLEPPRPDAVYDDRDRKNQFRYLREPIIPKNPVYHKSSGKGDYLIGIERVPVEKLYETAYYYLHLIQLLLGLFTILSIVSGVYLSRNFLSPINKIIKGTEEISKGNLDYLLNITTGDEFENLANHFNSMVGELKTLYHNLDQKVIERTRELADTKEILAREKEQLEAVLNATKDGIIMIDPEGYLVFANRSFNEMFEFSALSELEVGKWNIRELVARKELFQDTDKYMKDLENLLEKPNDVMAGQIVKILPKLLIINYFSAPVVLEKGDTIGRIIAFRDVTREKEVERMKDEFVSIVSHELRTPMTSLGGSLSLVLDGTVGEINEDQRDLLEIAKNNTTRLIRLINDILDISKIESGKIKMKLEPVDIKNVIADSVEGIKSFAANHSVFLKHDIEEDLPMLNADKDRLIQVVTNLLSNAIKFSPKEGIVHIKAWKKEEKLYVHVKDEGPGIPADYLEKIFEKFQQVDSTSSRQKGGTGLGLPICRAIIGELGGKLWVESEEGKGSTFTFYLPSGEAEQTA